jgi:hypothetical protein
VCDAIKRYLGRLQQRRRSYREGRRGTVYEIEHDANHMSISWLTIENEKGIRLLTWDETISIKAFKRDLYAVDRLCLLIGLSDGSGIEVDEEMSGWDSLVQQLPEYLPGCKSLGEWFEVVAFPAFQLNMTPIFDRAS